MKLYKWVLPILLTMLILVSCSEKADTNTQSTDVDDESTTFSSKPQLEHSGNENKSPRDLLIGEMIKGVEYEDFDGDIDSLAITEDEAVEKIFKFFEETEQLKSDDKMVLICDSIRKLNGYYFYSIGKGYDNGDALVNIEQYYVDADTGSVYVKGIEGDVAVGIDTLTRLS